MFAALLTRCGCVSSMCTVMGDITTPLDRSDDSADLGTRHFSIGAVASICDWFTQYTQGGNFACGFSLGTLSPFEFM